MARTPLLIVLFALMLTFWQTPSWADDQASNFETSTALPTSYEAREEIGQDAVGSPAAPAADPFDVTLILTLTIGIIGLISVRRYVKS